LLLLLVRTKKSKGGETDENEVDCTNLSNCNNCSIFRFCSIFLCSAKYTFSETEDAAMRTEGLIKFLNLSEEQITEINKSLLDFQKDTIELRNRIQIKELEIKALLLEPQTELEKVKAKMLEIADLQIELKVKTIEKYLEIKGLLTSEQQAKLPLGIPSQIFALEKFSTGRMMNSFCW